MAQAVRWIFLWLYLVICSGAWYFFPENARYLGGAFSALFVDKINPVGVAGFFCILVAVLIKITEFIGFTWYFREGYDRLGELSNTQHRKDAVRVIFNKIFRDVVLAIVFSVVVVVFFINEKFYAARPNVSFVDFIIISMAVRIIVEGLLDFIKFIPMFVCLGRIRGA